MSASLVPVAQLEMVLVFVSKLAIKHLSVKLQTLLRLLKVVKKQLCNMNLTDLFSLLERFPSLKVSFSLF